MSKKELVKRVQGSVIAMRPVLPLGQPLGLGSVGTIDDDGNFSYQGTIGTMLGLNNLGRELEPVSLPSLQWSTTTGKDVSVGIGSRADTSGALSRFANLKGFATITFGSRDSTFIAVKGLTVRAFAEPKLFMNSMLSAYEDGIWTRDMVFVYRIGIARNITLVINSEAGTKVGFKASAKVAAAAAADVDLAAGFKMQIATNSVEQVSGARNLVAFYSAYRIGDPPIGKPKVVPAERILFGTELNEIAAPIAGDAYFQDI